MKYILIIVLLSSTRSIAIDHIIMPNEAACYKAADQILKKIDNQFVGGGSKLRTI